MEAAKRCIYHIADVIFSSAVIMCFFHLTHILQVGDQIRGWQRGDRDPVSRTNFNKIHASRFESDIVGETSGKRNFHDKTQIIHESRIPHEINHASHAFRYSRITFLFKYLSRVTLKF